MTPIPISIRRSTASDAAALAWLAQLDGAGPPSGPHLLAEEDGKLRAALPLGGGPPLADPFHRTADLVTMLRLRRAALRPGEPTPRPRPRRGGLRLPLPRRLAAASPARPAP